MYTPFPACTYVIIVVTCITSILVFRNRALEQKYIFWPEGILAWKEYHRLVTSSFLHADARHLLMNMLTLFFFGQAVEMRDGPVRFLLIYFGAIIGGKLLSLYVHRHHDYRSYGASGGVCGVLFAYILLFPGGAVNMFFLPIAIPGWLYAIGYLAFSFFGMKEHRGDVGHDAHLGGAIIGLLIAAALDPGAVRANLLVFLIVLVPAILLLAYLWMNPLFLPLSSFFGGGSGSWRLPSISRRRSRPAAQPGSGPELRQVDAILEKISKKGINSLTPEEKATLDEVAGKFKRRADSKKPESGLTF